MEPLSNKIRIHFPDNPAALLQITTAGYTDYTHHPSMPFFRIFDGYMLHYVQRGKGMLNIRDTMYSTTAGSLFFVPPDIPVRYYADSEDPWVCFHFYMYGDGAYSIGKQLGLMDGYPFCAAKYPTVLNDAFFTLFEYPSKPLDLLYSHALAAIGQLLVTQGIPNKLPVQQDSMDLASKVKQIIEYNYTCPDFSVNAISHMLYISHSYMCKQFKAQTGVSPISYLAMLRLQCAASLCAHEDYSVKELCAMSGFRDVYHFMKRFKQQFGMTIQEYKRSVLEEN